MLAQIGLQYFEARLQSSHPVCVMDGQMDKANYRVTSQLNRKLDFDVKSVPEWN